LRDVNIEGKMTFQFRAEVTNVMNWVSLGLPELPETSRIALRALSPQKRRHPAPHSGWAAG
jgi:hypothetical protein